ncbi:MAG: hypothetical protein U9Q69_00055 [Nanoarchaeota archaeon]|nr:hypothetical protein [Nanoarchaeota archaeon]
MDFFTIKKIYFLYKAQEHRDIYHNDIDKTYNANIVKRNYILLASIQDDEDEKAITLANLAQFQIERKRRITAAPIISLAIFYAKNENLVEKLSEIENDLHKSL